MIRWFFGGALSFMIALFLPPKGLAVGTEPGSLRESIETNRRHLLVLNADGLRMREQNASWFADLLGRVQTGSTISDEELQRALIYIGLLGRQGLYMYRDTGFITDDRIVLMLAHGVKEQRPETREYSIQTLANECLEGSLQRYASVISEGLGSPRSHFEWLLYGRLASDDSVRAALAANPEAPEEVRARAGNKMIEGTLITNFEAETDYQAKARRARQLGYVATHACAKSLIRGLRSPVVGRGPVDERSIRGEVLLALGHIYPDEPLFTRDAIYLTQTNDRDFDRVRGIQEYVRDVNTWVRAKFSESAWDVEPTWFVRYFPHPRY